MSSVQQIFSYIYTTNISNIIFQEQSFGHAQALGKNEANFIKTKTKSKPFFENVTIESRLAHLRVNEAWD